MKNLNGLLLTAAGLALICVLATAQPEKLHTKWSLQFEIPDDDGILSIKQEPFDWKNNFIIGRDLHVNRFDDQQRGLELLKECYFNWADCSSPGKQDYELCEKLGLSVIVPNPRALQMGRHLWGQDWMKMTDEEVDAFVKQWVEQSGNSKAIVGYLIIDEPGSQYFPLQAYTSLAADADGIRWYTYYQGGYDYSPINEKGQRTNSWYMVREVNRHLSILGPMIKNLKSTGVYFTDPTIDPSLPLLPGKIVKGVERSEPLMIGEFESSKGNRYVMVVNISLEHSARFVLKTNIDNERLFYVSTGEYPAYFREIITAESREATQVNSEEQIALSKQKVYWLPAGYGLLIKCSGIVDK